jgi:predicted amidophosphoribosyltransferase
MRQVSAVHYEDIYPKSFVAFRKKYMPLLKSVERRHLYVQFTNFMDDTLSKKPYEDPDHHDPVAIYAYPLEYVLKHPADIWYGGQAKYLRVLKERKNNKTLLLQYLTEWEANSILSKMGLPYDSMEKAKALWPDRVGKGTGSIGRAFFQAMQMDMSAVGKIPRAKDERKALADTIKVRSGKEQTALLRKAGFDAIEDNARNQKTAVINPREPEQIAFLHRNSFDVVEIVPLSLKQTKTSVGTSQDPKELAPKLAAMVADRIGDRLVDRDGNRVFWTAGGREIVVEFDRPMSYYEGKKLGEKKHRESKLTSPYRVKVTLNSERGSFSPMAMASEKFVDIADDVASRFNAATPVEGYKPINRASREAEKKAASVSYYNKEKQKKLENLKRWVPDYIKDMTEVAQKLGVPFTQAEYFNSSDDARELLDGIMTVVGRNLTNEKYRATNRLHEEDPTAWDWYSKYDRQKAIEGAKESISLLAEDVSADPAVVREVADLYEASLNWMLDNKTWSYQNPTGFFSWVLRDMKESEPAVAVEAAVRLLAEAAELLNSIPVYSAFSYVSTTKYPSASPSHYKARQLVLDMKRGDRQAAKVIAKWLVRKYPRLLDFKGTVVPAARSTKERKPHLHFANALFELGVGSSVADLFQRTKDLPSSRGRRQAGLPGTTMEEHLGSLAVTGEPVQGGVLIVDDVITSGAMLKASVRVLKRAGFSGPFLAATAAVTIEEPSTGQALSPKEGAIQAKTKLSGYLVNDVVRLKDYLTMDDAGKGYEIARTAWPLFVGWAEETQPDGIDVDGLDADDQFDAETNLDNVPNGVFARFWKWFDGTDNNSFGVIGFSPRLAKYVRHAEQPTFLYMEFERIVKDEWMVHFSKNSSSIATDGFKYGIDDITTLGLTTHFFNKTKPGFNFAYLAKDAVKHGSTAFGEMNWKYGDHAVMFKANGVLVYHRADQEPQVIFLGSTAKDIVELENTDDGWAVIGNSGPVFQSGDFDTKERKTGSSRGGLQRCIDWVKTNYNQYKRVLSQRDYQLDTLERELAAKYKT